MKTDRDEYYAVDLFCGGGGLSQGLKEAGFTVVSGVELDLGAAETYRENHPQTQLFVRDIRTIKGKDLVDTSPIGRIDLIAACPPGQGFSTLTTKYKREDERNSLIFEFVRLVEEIRPKTIMMENVPGLATGRGKSFFSKALARLEAVGYVLDYKICDVAKYGVPQHRRRLVLLGALGKQIKVAEETHGLGKGRMPYRTVRNTISHIPKPTEFNSRIAEGGAVKTNWNVVRHLSRVNIERLKSLPSESDRRQLPDYLRPECHKGNDKGFCNVYGRMKWDEPSPTITGGCTTFSKGRFGHPDQNRTISVLEAALLQTFPETYVFQSPSIEVTCKIIGNALPPEFAKTMAKQCMLALKAEER